VVVVPCLAEFVDHAASVCDALPSPDGVRAMESERPNQSFALGCEKTLNSAFASFEPPNPPVADDRRSEPPEWRNDD
jgi:hypothetical protein